MSLVRKTRAELKDFRLTPAQQARLDAKTDAEITAAAKADPDNPPITAAEFSRMRRPGRPPLAADKRKVSVTLRLPPEVAAFLRERGRGWQTDLGDALLRAITGKGGGLLAANPRARAAKKVPPATGTRGTLRGKRPGKSTGRG